MTPDTALWRVKLGARLHDPAEKALVLMRDPGTPHDQGTVAALRDALIQPALTAAEEALIRRADHWAAAADRPQYPRSAWAQVRFAAEPELVHPLSGERLKLGDLRDVQVEAIKAVSLDHFRDLAAPGSARRTALAFWRFGPESPATGLGALWGLLPADTRIPDHTIWAHLDLVSAFAGAFAADPQGEVALLAVSLGPVQDFIAIARKASDLWAGSHLLSSLAWQAMRVVAERFGPDAILLPQLRGLPLVDAWLQRDRGLDPSRFEKLPWRQRNSDANPLFTASLPNRFLALVPAASVRELAKEIECSVRGYALEQAGAAARRLAELTGADPAPLEAACTAQLAGFPEIHWAAAPWPSATNDAGLDALRQAAAPFCGSSGPAFLSSPAWALLSREIILDGHPFFEPNPGALYPAAYDLLDRLHAAAKSLRPFEPLRQAGARCTQCGERDCLGGERPWQGVAERKPAWAKPRERLCALCALKRLWPTLFTDWANDTFDLQISRYSVSTHTMALATTFGRLENNGQWGGLVSELTRRGTEPVALPRSLARAGGELGEVMRRLPDALDRDDEHESEDGARAPITRQFEKLAGEAPEHYYALLLMDGDHMGAWLSGETRTALPFRATWHSRVANDVAAIASANTPLADYLNQPRPASPARHIAISEALHAFASHLAPYVVEERFKGKLIYAGGDDLLAMVSVDDLLPCLAALRAAFRGTPDPALEHSDRGFARLCGRLHRLMGDRATASFGAAIAHFSQPLGFVLRELRAAEKDAKHAPKKDAFSIRLLKRSGGATRLTLPFLQGDRSTAAALAQIRDALAADDVSRRAAYHIQSQLPLLPPSRLAAMLPAVLSYQFESQGGTRADAAALGELALAAAAERPGALPDIVRDIVTVAEFLARESRAPRTPQPREEVTT